MPEKTKEDFTDIDGTWYFCSGDIGQIDPDGCLRVIGRYLELGVRSVINVNKKPTGNISLSLGKWGLKSLIR